MDYNKSSQRERWIFTPERLHEMRARRHREAEEKYLKACEEARGASASAPGSSPPAPLPPPPPVPTLAEEHVLLRYCASSLLRICRSLRSPRSVRSTATAYLWRAYLAWSPLQRDPRAALLACIYLASKAEEAYVSAAELSRLSGTSPDAILRGEVALLGALQYDLAIHGPFRAAAGFLEDDDLAPYVGLALRAEQERHGSSDEDPPTAAAVEAALGRDAEAACDALLLTDAPMLHAPGRLGLAAVRSAFAKRGVRIDEYLSTVVRKAQSAEWKAKDEPRHGQGGEADAAKGGRGDGTDDSRDDRDAHPAPTDASVARLLASLSEIDALAAAAGREAARDERAVGAIDAKLRACREAARAPAGSGGDQARAKEERKAKERAVRRAAAEAAVGVSDL